MSMKPSVIFMSNFGRVLGTRELGRRAATDIREAISDSDKNVLIDFSEVEIASSPFLDEVACSLRSLIRDNPDRHVVLASLNDDVRDTLELVLERRKMGLAALEGEKLNLLGGRQHLQDTLDEAQHLREFTASQLADRLELKLPNLHQRLTKLEEAGALVRKESASGSERALVFSTPDPRELVKA